MVRITPFALILPSIRRHRDGALALDF